MPRDSQHSHRVTHRIITHHWGKWVAHTLIIACLLSNVCLSYAAAGDVDGFIFLPGSHDRPSVYINVRSSDKQNINNTIQKTN